MKSSLYTTLDGLQQPRTYAIGGSNQQRQKKLHHRRNGSGGGCYQIPKSSPTRDRRYQSEPEIRKVKLVSTETQTENITMEMSETDASPSPYMASRELSLCLREQSVDDEGNDESPPSQVMSSDDNINEEYFQQHLQLQHHLHPTKPHEPEIVMVHKKKQLKLQQQQQFQDNNSSVSLSSPISPNGNSSMTRSDITNYQDACSSPDDQLDDVVNSNEQLDTGDCLTVEYSDDDKLKTLGRKVYEFITENRLSNQSTMDNGNNMICETMTTAKTNGSAMNPVITETITLNNGTTTTGNANVLDKNRLNTPSSFDGIITTARRGYVSVNANSEVTVIRCGNNCSSNDKVIGVYNSSKALKTDICDDSWTDEEGEIPDHNYRLRRKR